MVTSAASYAIFKNRAWARLNNNAYAAMAIPNLMDELYDNCYSQPTVVPVPAKVALTGRPLLQKMRDICANYGAARDVLNQSTRALINAPNLSDVYDDRDAYLGASWFVKLCCCCCMSGSSALTAAERSATTAYLHAYQTPPTQNPPINWRIVANVVPTDLDQAVTEACTIIDNYKAEINEFKISAPGFAGKPDSLIFYMDNTTGNYNAIRNAIQLQIGALTLQGTCAPMVDELMPGLGECSEPPLIQWNSAGGNDPGEFQFSFGTYRCFLTAMAYQSALATAGGLVHLNQGAFNNEVDAMFARYGVPIANPHTQQAINYVAGNAHYTAFMNAIDDCMNYPAGTVAGRHAHF